jgi:hypothetical protein
MEKINEESPLSFRIKLFYNHNSMQWIVKLESYNWKQQKKIKGENILISDILQHQTPKNKHSIFLHVYYSMREMDNFKWNKRNINN